MCDPYDVINQALSGLIILAVTISLAALLQHYFGR